MERRKNLCGNGLENSSEYNIETGEQNITVTLKISHALESFVPRRIIDRDMIVIVQKDASVDDVVRKVAGLSNKVTPLIFINGHHAKPFHTLKSGDRITLWMPMAGG